MLGDPLNHELFAVVIVIFGRTVSIVRLNVLLFPNACPVLLSKHITDQLTELFSPVAEKLFVALSASCNVVFDTFTTPLITSEQLVSPVSSVTLKKNVCDS